MITVCLVRTARKLEMLKRSFLAIVCIWPKKPKKKSRGNKYTARLNTGK